MGEARMTTAEVVNAIERELARLLAAIDALGGDAASVPVTEEGWTAKDVLAHLIHWMEQIAVGLGVALQPPAYVLVPRDKRPTGDEWNAIAVDASRGVPLEEMRLRFETLANATLAQVRMRTDDAMNVVGAISWAGQRPLWHQVGGDTFLHWPLHSEAIERAATRR